MATPHVPLPDALKLDPQVAPAQGFLEQHDPCLRLRKSAETSRYYVLERRVRRQTINHLGSRDLSDMHVQARDGYVHVSLVHPQLALRPWVIVQALKEQGVDLFEVTAEQCANDLDYEEQWAKETRRRRRMGLYRDIAGEHFDLLARRGDAEGGTNRTRFSNPGMSSAAPSQ